MLYYSGMSQYFRYKLINPILDFLKQGISPRELALAIVIGFAVGTFPMLGVTTIICAALAVVLKLNMVVIQLINYFVYPLQLVLFVPFIKVGGIIFNKAPFPYSINEVISKVQSEFLITIKELFFANMLGILSWAFIIIPLAFIMFYILKVTFQRIKLSF